ncbi:hypothetical protein AMAG_00672 [Allomyces macrogynus ATCC 38327]|uniref:Uncharacterized protein n=1 Tax=Allomyces macrogynus (strain ATCC 38327) TaxID=578462 RepID=A0A0L0RWH7_ALLM3|nr:hypothetical protein AMAG_00672 [Allomyces macrogynus ATCC 38327]|eukprot:KNE54713.1 hypothetical protein AMAG_00672 [Allomyces macrogynus ATCC 38327]
MMTVGRRFFVLRAKSHPHPPAAVAAAPAADARALHLNTAVPADAAFANRPHQTDPADPPTIDDATATPADPDPSSRKKRRALRFPKLSVRRPSKPPPATRDHPDPGLDEPPPTPAVPPSALTEALGDGIDDVALVLAAALHEDPSAMDVDAASTSDDDTFWDPSSDAAAAAAGAAHDLAPTAAAAAAGRPRRSLAPPVPLSVTTRNLGTPLSGTNATSAVTTVPPTLVVTAPPPPSIRPADVPVEATAAAPVVHAHRPHRALAAWVHVMMALAVAAWQYVQACRWLHHPALVDAVHRTRGDPDQINWLSPLTYVALLTYPIPEAAGGGKDRAVGGASEDAPSGGGAVAPANGGAAPRAKRPQQATERRAKFSTLRDTHIVQQRRRNVLALTLYTLTMRWVSADAFIVLMLASQALLLYFMKNSRRINLQMAKTNLKNRVGWAKQWAGGLFRRHAPAQPPSLPKSPSAERPAQPVTNADDLDLDFDDPDDSSPGPDDDDENHLADTEEDPVQTRARGGARRENSSSPTTTPRIRRRMPILFRRNTPPPPAPPAGPSLAVVAAATQNRRITLFRRSQSTPVSPAAQHATLPPLPLPFDPPHSHPPVLSLHAVSLSVPLSTVSVETSRATHTAGTESDTGHGTASLAASPPPSSSSRLSIASLVRAPSSTALAARTPLAPVPEAGCDADAAPAAEPDAIHDPSGDVVAVVDDTATPGLVVTRAPVVLPSDSSYHSIGDGGSAATQTSIDAPRHESDDHGTSELVVPPVTSGSGRAASTRRQSAKAAVVGKARDLWSHVKGGGGGHHGVHAEA